MSFREIQYVAERVHDLSSFLDFLEALMNDWEAATVSEKASPSSSYSSMYGWENTSIGSFLEAAIAGARDNKLGQPGNYLADSNPWRQAAEIMLLGKIYE
ncbi:hypothetical protein [Rhodobacter sp. SY28-1]|uniref:DUF7660 family protein n=1 Tax=Rhodobacter sp. SY28-1 TaxID=2562317 RepID=UPI0010BF6992|nr:hypothetical protein [Rhodobacter sp. SY28-1]